MSQWNQRSRIQAREHSHTCSPKFKCWFLKTEEPQIQGSSVFGTPCLDAFGVSPIYRKPIYCIYIYTVYIYVCMYVYIHMGLVFMGLWDLQDGKPKDHFQDERNIVTGWWFGTELDYFSIQSFSGEFHHPDWRTHIFQRGWNHQPVYIHMGMGQNLWLSYLGVSSCWFTSIHRPWLRWSGANRWLKQLTTRDDGHNAASPNVTCLTWQQRRFHQRFSWSSIL